MKVKKTVYDAATGEYKEIYEEDLPSPEEPEIIQEQTLEEKVQELQNNVLNLQSVLISQKISGGGITITDSSALSVKDFGMRGKTEQASTTGKNLFDITKLKSNMISAENINIEESTITLPVGGAVYFNKLKDVCTDLKVGDEVYLFAKSTGTKAFAGFYHETASTPSWNFNTKQIVTDEMLNGALLLYSDSDKSVVLSGIMITKLNDKTYEPYTGGKPSPSVEYPQEIESAGDDGQIDVKVTGKNLFDISQYDKYDDTWTNTTYTTKKLKLKPNTTYTMSCKRLVDKPKQYVIFNIVSGIKTGKAISVQINPGLQLNYFTGKGTFTTGETGEIVLNYYVDCPKDQYWFTEVIGDIQIELGSAQTDYEPYREPQVLAIPLERPLTKFDRIEKQYGVYGVVYKHRVVEDFATLVRDNEPIYGNPGEKYFSVKADDATLNYDYSKICSEVGLYKKDVQKLYVPKVMQNGFIIHVNDIDTIETAKEHMHYKVIYETDAEEFVPLPEETQIALNNLHTNYPTTIISNSEDCDMKVEYIADTKNYIDKQMQAIVTKQTETDRLILERTM